VARPLGGAAVLAVLAARLGADPFVDGVRLVSAWSLLAATAITALTTVCCAWRWRAVARGLGVDLPLETAIAACYRSQLLNSALPGGVVGDLHRGVRHGRESGHVGRGLRAVVWERAAGQLVLVVLALLALLALESPVQPAMRVVVPATAAGGLLLVLAVRALPCAGRSPGARAVRAARDDLRAGLLDRGTWPVVAGTSLVVAVGHGSVFLVAAWTTGTPGSALRLWPLAMLVLLAMALPVNVGGWGPREGVAAWVFGAAGLGAAQGLATATAYGVMALVATLPGAVVLAHDLVRTRRRPLGRAAVEPAPDARTA
jgi:uncharacterized membrane protein YbhN (UPF0104 family)